MPGRAPKPAALRRRRNKTTGPRVLSVEGSGRKPPPLSGSRGMLSGTREWWRTVWASPMAMVWLDADVPALTRLARLTDLSLRGEATASHLAEIRQLEDRFGLSPLARRRLEWEVKQAQGGAEEAPAEERAKPDDERWLKAVE